MCVINQSEIKVADADILVYKYVSTNQMYCYKPGCLNVYHGSTNYNTKRHVNIPCTFSYKDKAINFENNAGYTCFSEPPDVNLTEGRSTLKMFLIKKGTRYKTGFIAPECDYEHYYVLQAEQLEEFAP